MTERAPARRAAAAFAGLTLAMLAPLARAGDDAPPARLAFAIGEGLNLNSFLRQGPIAAHLVLRSGQDPRVLIAFPAGNSAIGLWFNHLGAPARWRLEAPPEPATGRDGQGRPLYGVSASVSLAAADVSVRQALLSNARVLRDYQAAGAAPAVVLAPLRAAGQALDWSRDRLDGAAGYSLQVEVADGVLRGDHILAGRDGRIGLRITALSGEPPLTPLDGSALLDDRSAAAPPARNALAFLSYREKFLAGSWRFNTYFGRDTLMSVRMLMPALQPDAVEDGLRAVFARLSPDGEVAHEEDIGEKAILDHLKADGTRSDAPVFNYAMVDGAFMLAPVAAAWLLDDPRGRARAASFLAQADGRYGAEQHAVGRDLVANLALVVRRTQPFAEVATVDRLIGLKAGMSAGEWRDSHDGLGGGRYPYDVNAVLAPAALEAAQRLLSSGLLNPYLDAASQRLLGHAGDEAAAWRRGAPALFDVQITPTKARQAVRRYAGALGVPAGPALKAIGDRPVRFHALALTADGTPIRIVNSDDGFDLLFGHPSAAALDAEAEADARPFPAGLMTPVGLLVANPVFAAEDLQARFGPGAYHGTVVWSWQQALLAAGLQRQLRRSDLPRGVRNRLLGLQTALWDAIHATASLNNSELWSWRYDAGCYRATAFGASQSDVDESNAAQLWSTVYLAVRPPPGAEAAAKTRTGGRTRCATGE